MPRRESAGDYPVALSLLPTAQGWRTARAEDVPLSLREYFAGLSVNPEHSPAETRVYARPEGSEGEDSSSTCMSRAVEPKVQRGQAAQQYVSAGLLDEIRIHLVPVLLGEGKRLLDHLGGERIDLEPTRVLESPEGVTHLRFRVKR